MFPAIFAVLLLSRLSAAEIYVGQNPQNVNAVIKDDSGNLMPVTGVADTIEVVDLNYGNESDNETGMAVDISVTPVNATSSGTMSTMPVSEYPTMNTMPVTEYPTINNGIPTEENSNIPATGVPSTIFPPSPQPSVPITVPSFPPAGPSAPASPPISYPPMNQSTQPGASVPASPPISNLPVNQSTQPAFNPTTTTASANSPSGPITPLPSASGPGSSANPPTAFPFSPSNPESSFNNLVSSFVPSANDTSQSSNANSVPPSLLGGPSSVSNTKNIFNSPTFKTYPRFKRSIPLNDETSPLSSDINFPLPSVVTVHPAQSFETITYPAQPSIYSTQPITYPAQTFKPVTYPTSNVNEGTNFATQNYVDELYPRESDTPVENVFSNPLSQFSSIPNPVYYENTQFSGVPNTWSSGYPTTTGWPVSGPYVNPNPEYTPIPAANPVSTQYGNSPAYPYPESNSINPYPVSNPENLYPEGVPLNPYAVTNPENLNPESSPINSYYPGDYIPASNSGYLPQTPTSASLRTAQSLENPETVVQLIQDLIPPSTIIPVFPVNETILNNAPVINAPTSGTPPSNPAIPTSSTLPTKPPSFPTGITQPTEPPSFPTSGTLPTEPPTTSPVKPPGINFGFGKPSTGLNNNPNSGQSPIFSFPNPFHFFNFSRPSSSVDHSTSGSSYSSGAFNPSLSGVDHSPSGLGPSYPSGSFNHSLTGVSHSSSGLGSSKPSGPFNPTLSGVNHSPSGLGPGYPSGSFNHSLTGVSHSSSELEPSYPSGPFNPSLSGVNHPPSGLGPSYPSGSFNHSLPGVSHSSSELKPGYPSGPFNSSLSGVSHSPSGLGPSYPSGPFNPTLSSVGHSGTGYGITSSSGPFPTLGGTTGQSPIGGPTTSSTGTSNSPNIFNHSGPAVTPTGFSNPGSSSFDSGSNKPEQPQGLFNLFSFFNPFKKPSFTSTTSFGQNPFNLFNLFNPFGKPTSSTPASGTTENSASAPDNSPSGIFNPFNLFNPFKKPSNGGFFNLFNIFNPFKKPSSNGLFGQPPNAFNPSSLNPTFSGTSTEPNSNPTSSGTSTGPSGSSALDSGSNFGQNSFNNPFNFLNPFNKPSTSSSGTFNPLNVFNPFKKPSTNAFNPLSFLNPFSKPSTTPAGIFNLFNIFNPFKKPSTSGLFSNENSLNPTVSGTASEPSSSAIGSTTPSSESGGPFGQNQNSFNLFSFLNPFKKPSGPFSGNFNPFNIFNPFKKPSTTGLFGNSQNSLNPTFSGTASEPSGSTTDNTATSNSAAGSKSGGLFGQNQNSNPFSFLNPFKKANAPFGGIFNPFKNPSSTNTINPFALNPTFTGTSNAPSSSSGAPGSTLSAPSGTSSAGNSASVSGLSESKSNGLFSQPKSSFNPFGLFNPFKKATGSGSLSTTNPLIPFSQPSASSPGKSPFGNLFGFNPFKPFGSGPRKNPLGNLFVELGGSLGPVVQPSNNVSQSINPSQSFANGTSQPISLVSSASGNINSPSTDDEDSISSILNNSSPMDAINQLLFPNSSSANSSITENDLMDIDEEMDPLSLLENFAPSMADNLPNITTVPLNLSDLGNSLNGTFHKWNDALSSSLRSAFPSVSRMFGAGNSSPLIFSITPSKNASALNFTNFFAGQNTTMPSINNLLNSLLNTSTSFNFTNLLMPSNGTSPSINKLLNSLVSNSAKPINFINPFSMGSLPTLGVQNMLNNLLPSMLSPSLVDPLEEDPEDITKPDYLDGLSMPSMFGNFPSMFSNLNLQQNVLNPLTNGTTSLSGMMSMVQNLLTPNQNGTIPFASMVSNIFKPNSTMLFGPSPLLNSSFFNPMNFTSPVNTSSLFTMNNNQPLSNWNTIISVLNSTGMFGDLSGLSSMIQNLSDLAKEAKSGNNKMTVLKQALSDVTKMSNITNSIMKNFMKNVGLSPTQNLTSLIAQAESNSNTSAELNEALSDVMSMWNFARQKLLSSLKNVGFNPSAFNRNSFLPSSFPFPSRIPKFPPKSPKPPQPLVNPNFGTSFLVIPTSPPNLENDTLLNSVPFNLSSSFGSLSPMSGNLNLQEQVFNPLTDGKTSLNNLISMVNNLLTPNQNGTDPFQSMLDSIFKPNSTMLFGPSPLLNSSFFNPMNFTSSVNMSSPLNLTEKQAFIDWNSIISGLNNTGMFGDLSGLSSVLSNVSSLIAEANSGANKMAVLKQALSYIGGLWKYTNSISQTFLKNLNLTGQDLTSRFSQFENSDDGSAELNQALKDVANTWSSIFKMLGLNPSAFNLNPFLPSNLPPLSFPPRSPMPFPSRLPLQFPSRMSKLFPQPLVSPSIGSSFLVIPPSPPAVQSDILTPVSPVVNSTLVFPPRNGSSMPMVSANATAIPVTVSVNQSSQPLSISPSSASANESLVSQFASELLNFTSPSSPEMQNSAPAAPTDNSTSTKTDDAVFDYVDTSATNLDNSTKPAGNITTAKPSEGSDGSYKSSAYSIGINASPTLIILIGFLFVAINQKMFA